MTRVSGLIRYLCPRPLSQFRRPVLSVNHGSPFPEPFAGLCLEARLRAQGPCGLSQVGAVGLSLRVPWNAPEILAAHSTQGITGPSICPPIQKASPEAGIGKGGR